jgi:hypothetical protein
MARSLTAKQFLIVGDSNVERNLLHAGRLYSELADSVPARNLDELATALRALQPNKYKVVIFAMLTNIVITAGNSSPKPDLDSRLLSIEACLKPLIKDLRYFCLDFIISILTSAAPLYPFYPRQKAR